MQVPYGWIKELVDVPWSAEELANRLTLSGAESEVEKPYDNQFEGTCVGQIEELEQIPGSDHLKKAIVSDGTEQVQVVCGAPNAQKGQKIIFAKIGSILKGGLEIKKAKLRGVESYGMICSEAELGLSDDHSGIMVLDEDAQVGTPALSYLGLDDAVLKLDLTPNRSDLLSVIGVARDCACLAGLKVKRPDFTIAESGERASDYVKVSIDDPDACPRYAARIIKGIKIGPSPWWIKKKLLLCGIRPISNVVDITNYVMLEFGHPLHAFDYDRFDRKEILVRRAKEGEQFTTLDGKEHKLTREVLLITDGEKGVAAAGVMGGLDSEISFETTNILLESAYFNPVTIRRSRLKLGLISESSSRFEKGADPNIVAIAIDRAASLIQLYAGGEILSGIADCYPKKIAPAQIGLRMERVNSFLGISISKKRVVDILTGLEFQVEDDGILKVTVPTCHPDITREVDLIEEIVRIEGYEAIPFIDRNRGPLFTPGLKDESFRRRIRTSLTAQGYDETYGSGLADSGLLSKISGEMPQLRILNPIAEDLSVMQNSLVYSLLKSVSHNVAHRNIDLRLFELGKAFRPGNPPLEEEQVGIALTGQSMSCWFQKSRDFSMYDLKGAIDSLAESCRLPAIIFRAENQIPYLEAYSFSLMIGDEKVGHAGQVIDSILQILDVKQPVFIAVLNFEKILSKQEPERSFKILPRFPAAPRDLAVVVDDSVSAGDMLSDIKMIAGDLLESVEIFDLYRGKQIGEGMKSLAFSMIYRSIERSLESREVIEIHNKIADHLKKHFNAEIREG